MKKIVTQIVLITVMFALRLSGQSGLWNDNFEEAAVKAKTENKYMLLNFSGSDWCSWCIRLDKEVLSQTVFQDYAKENLILMIADFPRYKQLSGELEEQNQKLAEKYKIEGFPTVIILDPDKKVAGITGFQIGGAKKYVDHIKMIIQEYEAQ
jgi:protein disulfide-isomerase